MNRSTISSGYLVLVLCIILSCSGKPKLRQEIMPTQFTKTPSKDSITTTKVTFITLPNLEDTSIFKALYGKDEVMIIDMNDGTDTTYMSIDSRFKFKEENKEYVMI